MKWHRSWLSLAGIAAVAASATAGSYWVKTRPICRPGVPVRDYQYGKRSESLFAVCLQPIPSGEPMAIAVLPAADASPLPAPPPSKAFQLPLAGMQIEQCGVSSLCLMVRPDGIWTLNLRADQNAQWRDGLGPESVVDVRTGRRLQTAQIKRNRFHVIVRCYVGSSDNVAQPSAAPIGRPLVEEIVVDPFWVQRCEPRFISDSGASETLQQNFGSMDRVEVEFYFDK